jgi:hypothetical protein
MNKKRMQKRKRKVDVECKDGIGDGWQKGKDEESNNGEND